MKNLHDYIYPAACPSLLAANKNEIKEEILFAEKCGSRFIHIDVMDGKFVPATSFGLQFVKDYSHIHSMVNDVHLMIEEPWKYVREFAEAGADIVTFHYEACPNDDKIEETIKNIVDGGANVGISIKPNTPVSVLKPFLTKVNLILLMSVEPGKGGQKFMPESLERLKEIRALFEQITPEKRPILEIDGGINENSAKPAHLNGAEILVAGSYLFGHEDFAARLQYLENLEGETR